MRRAQGSARRGKTLVPGRELAALELDSIVLCVSDDGRLCPDKWCSTRSIPTRDRLTLRVIPLPGHGATGAGRLGDLHLASVETQRVLKTVTGRPISFLLGVYKLELHPQGGFLFFKLPHIVRTIHMVLC